MKLGPTPMHRPRPSRSRWPTTVAVAAWVLLAGAGPARSAEPPPETPAQRAGRHFEAQEWDQAVEALIDAYAIDPDPDYLYARAQAERMRGNCRVALGLYHRYLDTQPSPAQVTDTEVNIRRCEEELWTQQAAAAPDPVPAPPRETSDPVVEAAAPVARDQPRPWHRDPAGGVLLATSIVALSSGATVWVLGGRWRKDAPDAATEDAYSDRARRGRITTAAGIATVGVGVALAVGAAVRYGIVARRRPVAIVPGGGPGVVMLGAAGRF